MDYSGVDDDHVDASPWASSPDHSRTTFPSNVNQHNTSTEPSFTSPYVDSSSSDAHQERGDTPYSRGPAIGEDGSYGQLPEAGPTTNGSSSIHPRNMPSEVPTGTGQQTSRPAAQRYHPQSASRPARTQYKLQAKVTELERTGKKDPILKFDVYTNLPKFRTTQFRDVRRTHSEFVKFGEHLISANPEALVPAVPSPVTAAGSGTEEDENRVMKNMQRWLNAVCSNEILMRDEEMIYFVESDFGYSPLAKRKQPATGVRRKVIKQFAPPPDDTPELSDARPIVKLFYLGTMDAGQKVDKLVKGRRALGLAESGFGQALSQLAPQETHPGLANAFRRLGATIRAVGDFHLQQGTLEAYTLSDPLTYHSSDAFIVKETLTNRQILMRELQQAQASTKSKLSAADRLRSSSSPRADKVDEAIAALDEAKRTEEQLTKKVHGVTANLIGERRRWFDRTSQDLRASLKEYVMRQIEAERRTLSTLEAVRPDIRAIDASGGLSRLGREAHPKVRRSSVANSQGPKGDAWSGVQRRPDGVKRVESGGLTALPVAEDKLDEAEEEAARKKAAAKGTLKGVVEDDDEDRVDARNAASRLAQTTF